MMKYLVSFILILTLSIEVYSQINQNGIPFIRNYSPKEYNEHNQNWAIVQDKRGVMYFGNGNGVLEYDGANWRLINVSNLSLVSSLAVDTSGIVYVGANGEFGCLLPDSKGLLTYKSISNQLDSINKIFGTVWRIYIINNVVYFCTFEALYRYELPLKYNHARQSFLLDQKKIKIWKPKTSFHFSFKVNEELFIRQDGVGLMHLVNDSLEPEQVEAPNFIEKNKPMIILPFVNQVQIIATGTSGLLWYDRNKKTKPKDRLIPFKLSDEDFIVDNVLYYGIKLNDGRYSLASLFKGVVIMDETGVISELYSKQTQLQDDKIWYLSQDQNSQLWMALNKGISKIEISSPFRIWNEYNGLKGIPSDILNFNDKLYVATSVGVFYLKKQNSGSAEFIQVQNINSESNCLLNFCPALYQSDKTIMEHQSKDSAKLLVSTAKGIYQIKNTEGELIASTVPAYKIYTHSQSPEKIFIALQNGIGVLSYSQNKWSEVHQFKQIKNAVMYLTGDNDTNIWASTDINGIYRISLNNSLAKKEFKENDYKISHYDTISGLPGIERNSVSNTTLGLFASTSKGLYKFEKQNHRFYPTSIFGKDFTQGTKDIQMLIEGKSKEFWIIYSEYGKYQINCLKQASKDNFVKISYPFLRLPPMYVNNIYPDSNGIAWIAGTEGLYSYNDKIQKNYQQPYPTLIRKVIVGRDSVIFSGTFSTYNDSVFCLKNNQQKQDVPILPYQYNDISFKYCTPYFEEEASNEFSYFLEGKDKNWSEWSQKKEKEFTNLGEGKYIFKIKAKNIYGVESQISEYHFQILPPFYRTIWAYLIYIIISAIIIWGIVKINTHRLVKEKERLEGIVRERTAEVVKQKEEIELKNQNLEQQKEEILTQNEELHRQKSQIENQAEELEIKNKELEKLSIVASETDNAVVIMDEQGNYEWINEGYTRLFGYTFSELIKEKGNNIISSVTNQEIAQLIQKSLTTKESVVFEFPTVTKTGSEIWIQTTLTPIHNHDGNIRKIVAIDSDITKIKDAEKEIAQQRDIATQQRDEIALAKKEITDSIHYAKRIQNALLPPEEYFQEALKEYFILFKPRDIVSGDYYWFRRLGNYIIIVAADCTGHGVPGAFMSMLGMAFLNEIVTTLKEIKASLILNELRIKVKASLRQTGKEGESKDGMDISLYIIDKENSKLQFAGAYNSLYIVRNNELTELKADKMPIGIYISEKESFTDNDFLLEPNDCIYSFSDGYEDQFGGEKGKKFMAKRFKELLIQVSSLPMPEQKQKLDTTIENWKACVNLNGHHYEQIDDILVVGVRI